METIEIIIYVGIAVVVGALIIGVIGGWDVRETYKGIGRLLRGGDADAYERLTIADVPRAALDVWDACGLGSLEMSKTVYVTDTGVLTKEGLFQTIASANLCRSLRSTEFGCGEGEDVVMEDISTPAILVLRCDATTRTLIIG